MKTQRPGTSGSVRGTYLAKSEPEAATHQLLAAKHYTLVVLLKWFSHLQFWKALRNKPSAEQKEVVKLYFSLLYSISNGVGMMVQQKTSSH